MRAAESPGALVAQLCALLLCLISLPTGEVVRLAAAGDQESLTGLSYLPDDTLRVGITPAELAVGPGGSFVVEIAILEEGPEFNGYDALVGYDPTRLTFLQMNPLSDQEGPLMTEACPNRFHLFNISPDSTVLTVNHVLLCAGVSVTGPGVVYRLSFQCKEQTGPTELRLLEGTVFFDGGLYVYPMLSFDAQVIISVESAVPDLSPLVQIPLQAHPNPFNPSTVLSFDLRKTRQIQLKIFTIDGRLARTLYTGVLSVGTHALSWDGRDQQGRLMPSGPYTARLQAADQAVTRSITLIK